jgi:hypothetical protein
MLNDDTNAALRPEAEALLLKSPAVKRAELGYPDCDPHALCAPAEAPANGDAL